MQRFDGCFYREHLTISEIHRRTSLSGNTIKKWLQEPGVSEPKYQRAKATGKLIPFEPMLLFALNADSHRPKRDCRTAWMLFEAIQKGASLETIPLSRISSVTGAHAIFETVPPQAFDPGIIEDGRERGLWKLQFGVDKLCFSNC